MNQPGRYTYNGGTEFSIGNRKINMPTHMLINKDNVPYRYNEISLNWQDTNGNILELKDLPIKKVQQSPFTQFIYPFVRPIFEPLFGPGVFGLGPRMPLPYKTPSYISPYPLLQYQPIQFAPQISSLPLGFPLSLGYPVINPQIRYYKKYLSYKKKYLKLKKELNLE